MKKCKSCGTHSPHDICPNCGTLNRKDVTVLQTFGVLILFGALAAFVYSDRDKTEARSKSEIRYAHGTVNIRKGPSTNTAVVRQLQAGDSVEIGQKEGDWARLKDGYVYIPVLKTEKYICPFGQNCWFETDAGMKAKSRCRRAVEQSARYGHRWVDKWHEEKWQRGGFQNGQAVLIGDKIELQNGFGAWSNHIYSCYFDPRTETAVEVSAAQGRL